jgi:hypothetical protein
VFEIIVQNLLLNILGGSPEHLFQNSSVMLTPSFGLFLDVLTNCTHPQFTVASVMTFQEPYEWERETQLYDPCYCEPGGGSMIIQHEVIMNTF